jgi:hypothetical protein
MLRMTMLQMFKLVLFAALASLCLAPASRLVEAGVGTWPGFLVMEGVVIPLVLAIAAFPLVRKGPFKEWMIQALLMLSLAVCLGVATFYLLLFSGIIPWRRLVGVTLPMVLSVVLAFVLIGFAFVLLSRRVVPGRCPECRRPTLLPATRSCVQAGPQGGRVYECLRCGGRYVKVRGAWTTALVSLEGNH